MAVRNNFMRAIGAIVAVVGWVSFAASAQAQGRPFVFTVTTAPPSSTERWTAHYDVGYADRAATPFGYNGLEQRARIQGFLGSGFTVLGEVAVGIDGARTVNGASTTQQMEILKDVTRANQVVHVAGGVGVRREWQGTTVLLGRASIGHRFARSSLFGNLRLEKPLAGGRDGLDLITSVGWLHHVAGSVHMGIETIGEDLEGFWEPEEAEGGAKLFVGPTVQIAPSRSPIYASLCGGPIVYATRSGRASGAARPLAATDNGYTLRFTVGYRFGRSR